MLADVTLGLAGGKDFGRDGERTAGKDLAAGADDGARGSDEDEGHIFMDRRNRHRPGRSRHNQRASDPSIGPVEEAQRGRKWLRGR